MYTQKKPWTRPGLDESSPLPVRLPEDPGWIVCTSCPNFGGGSMKRAFFPFVFWNSLSFDLLASDGDHDWLIAFIAIPIPSPSIWLSAVIQEIVQVGKLTLVGRFQIWRIFPSSYSPHAVEKYVHIWHRHFLLLPISPGHGDDHFKDPVGPSCGFPGSSSGWWISLRWPFPVKTVAWLASQRWYIIHDVAVRFIRISDA